jgi:hypothetical protein
MRRILSAALVAAVLVGAQAASAQTLANLFPPLSGEVATRLAGLTGRLTSRQRRQRAALTKASKFLVVETDDVGKTISDAVKVVAPLDAAYPGDATLPSLLDPVVTYVGSALSSRLNDLGASIAVLPTGKLKNGASAAKKKADAASVRFDSATTRARQLKYLAQEYAAVARGEKFVAKVAGVVASTRFAVAIDGKPFSLPGLPQFNEIATYQSADAGKFRLDVVGTLGETNVIIVLIVPSPGAGEHDLQIGMVPSPSSYMAGGPLLFAASGKMNFTTWSPVDGKVAGTFSATFTNGTTTVQLTNGAFSATNMQTQ